MEVQRDKIKTPIHLARRIINALHCDQFLRSELVDQNCAGKTKSH